MTLETGAIIGMIIGMIGVIALTAFAIWSKLDEDRGVASQDARINYSGDRGRQQYRPFCLDSGIWMPLAFFAAR